MPALPANLPAYTTASSTVEFVKSIGVNINLNSPQQQIIDSLVYLKIPRVRSEHAQAELDTIYGATHIKYDIFVGPKSTEAEVNWISNNNSLVESVDTTIAPAPDYLTALGLPIIGSSRSNTPIVNVTAGQANLPTDQFAAQTKFGTQSNGDQARLILNGLLDSFKRGVFRTYIYTLLDDNFGLFKADGTPYPAATAIRNFINWLGVEGTDTIQPYATNTGTSTFHYTVNNLKYGSDMLMQRPDGTYVLVVWAEPRQVVTQNATITVDNSINATVYDPMTDQTSTETGTSIPIVVSDHPVLIQFGGTPPASVAPTTPETTPSAADIPAQTAPPPPDNTPAPVIDVNANEVPTQWDHEGRREWWGERGRWHHRHRHRHHMDMSNSNTPTPTPTPAPAPVPQDNNPTPTPVPTPKASTNGPQTPLHFAAQNNFSNGTYTPAAAGFNLADVASPSALNSLPAGTKALVWLGDSVNGADSAFKAKVDQFAGNPKVFGFYLADEPTPSGFSWGSVHPSPETLKAESDYIHQAIPGAKTFVVAANLGSTTNPNYSGYITPANTGVDLWGLDPYPLAGIDPGGNYMQTITLSVQAAESAGIAKSQIVPVYQAFSGSGGNNYIMPTAAQEQQIIDTWGQSVPTPQFDYAFSWAPFRADAGSISNTPALQQVFLGHNE